MRKEIIRTGNNLKNNITEVYDDDNNLICRYNNIFEEEYIYDRYGNLIAVNYTDSNDYFESCQYNRKGDLISINSSYDSELFKYDRNRLLIYHKKIDENGTYVERRKYNKDGKLIKYTNSNGMVYTPDRKIKTRRSLLKRILSIFK